MRSLLLLSACMLSSACFLHSKAQVAPEPPAAPPLVTQVNSNGDCYTVDLFTDVKVEKPDKAVPPEHGQFLGNWAAGAWNGVWCHELLVTKVEPGGRVELVEMHAPYAPWHQPATAFRRVAHIDDEGNLRFAYGLERVSYRIENGRLIGSRSGRLGNLHVELWRDGEAPVPVQMPMPKPKPMRLAQLGTSPQPGG